MLHLRPWVVTCVPVVVLQEMSIPFSKAILDLNNRNVIMNILADEEFQLDSNECAYQVHMGFMHAISSHYQQLPPPFRPTV